MADRGKQADWAYRTILTAILVWGVNWLGGKVDALSSLPGQVRQLSVDVDTVKTAQAEMKKAQDDMKRTQSGFATAADVQDLRGDVDTLTGRVDAMQEQVNGLSDRKAGRK